MSGASCTCQYVKVTTSVIWTSGKQRTRRSRSATISLPTAVDWIVSPHNSYVEALTPMWPYSKVEPLGALQVKCGHKSGTLLGEDGCPYTKRHLRTCSLSRHAHSRCGKAMWRFGEMEAKHEALIRNHTSGKRLDLGLPSLQSHEKINFCCCKSSSLWYFVMAAGAD